MIIGRTRIRALAVGVAVCALAACSAQPEASVATTTAGTLRVAAGDWPQTQILEHVRQEAGSSLRLDIVPLRAGQDGNTVVEDGGADANYFQHVPALDGDAAEHHYRDLRVVAGVHVQPYGLYSRKWTSLAQVPHGGSVAVSDQPSSLARSLYLLQQAGLLGLAEKFGGTSLKALSIDENSVVSTERHLNVVRADPDRLPGLLPDVDLAVLNPDQATAAGLVPARDALVLERGRDNPYANVLVARQRTVADPRLQLLAHYLESDETAAYIAGAFDGAVMPVHGPRSTPSPVPASAAP